MEYNFREIESKWQKHWKDQKTYSTSEDNTKQKFYVLDMFPYPSGAGLHVGHPLGYIASDIIARYKKHQGFNVLHPMGYDSFGLPAEQYAIQTGQHPEVTTNANIARYREQLDKIGFAYDWDREVRTSDPDYYRWTQWIFSVIYQSWFNKDTNKAEHISTLIDKFEKNGNYNVNAACDEKWYEALRESIPFFGKDFEGDFSATDWKSMTEEQKQHVLMQFRMAYLADSVVNWCPALGTVLANDEIKDGVSERGGHPVIQKKMRQWSMRISAYADRLLQGLETIDWSESIKEVQRNWIGRSEGASVKFQVDGHNAEIEVFTTRPDTIFGVSFMTLAPEHELVMQITTDEYRAAVIQYIENAKLKTERDRQSEVKNITGQFTGAHVIHPFTGEKIQVWIGEYVLAGYGTGAVMAVPCGDQRDYDFAKKFGLTIPNILKDVDISEKAEPSKDAVLCNSQMLDGLSYKEATKKIIAEIEAKGIGKGKINYRMRDAVFSRQRYWGEPFPIYYKNEIPYLTSEEDLPVVLPPVDKYLPTEDGEPPLARAENWFYEPEVTGLTPGPSPYGEGNAHSETGILEEALEHYGNAPEMWQAWATANKDKWPRLKAFARAMRKEQTHTEYLLWQQLRGHKLSVKFRRQHAIGPFIADFVCLKHQLVIEADGAIHDHPDQALYDEARTVYLNAQGYRVLRFKNSEVQSNMPGVLDRIKKEIDNASTNIAMDLPLSWGEGSGVRLRKEYNTMPGWAGSSWYFLRYMDPHNEHAFASREKTDYWNQVDLYMGGAEHGTGHLLYSRFWTKMLFDLGYIGFDEPFKKMINQGMILGRSNFIYALKTTTGFIASSEFVAENKLEDQLNNVSTPVYIISVEMASKFLNKTISQDELNSLQQFIDSKFKEFNPNISDKIDQKLFHLPSSELDKHVRRLHVDVNIVNNDVLDEQAFLIHPLGEKKAVFIPNESGVISCHWEIEKMSKSKLNVITPDKDPVTNQDGIIEKFGADTLRLFEMFLGPVEQSKPWDTKSINGVHNFLRKLWRLSHDQNNEFVVSTEAPTKDELKTLHKTIKKISEDLDRYSWNTCVSAFMICVNELQELKCNKREILEPLVVLIAPFAPHIAEELWEKLGHTDSVTKASWPTHKEEYLKDDAFDYPVSFNGKTRYFLSLPVDMPQPEVESAVRANDNTAKYLEGKEIKKIIVVPKRIVNVVV
jgi:leucyl-tRNA synthetase/very-short-patch-repair endonuclease